MSSITVQHPSVFIREELSARGWTWDDLATAMMRSDDDNWGVHRLAIDLYFIAGPKHKDMRIGIGESAKDYARAFGVSPEFFGNMEALWLERGVEVDHECDDQCRCDDEATDSATSKS